MAAPLTLIVGHCTPKSARIFCCGAQGASAAVARMRYRAGGKEKTVELELTPAEPFHLGVFELTGLPEGAEVTYAVDVAESKAGLAAAGDLLAGGTRSFRLPAAGRPPRVAFVSCNGVYEFTPEGRKYVVWNKLKTQIEAGEVDLVVHGGDQVYADYIWMKHDSDPANRGLTPAHAERVRRITSQYRELYVKTWSAPGIADVLASVPNVMTWDDHDVYDGWGSHDEDDQPPQQAFFAAARQAYSEFQVSHGPGAIDPSSFLTGWTHEGVGFLVLDARSNRMWTKSRVLGDEQFAALKRWAEENARGLKRLYVVSSIPLVHAEAGLALPIVGWLPGGLEDDLRDTWVASNNRNECHRLVKWLLDLPARHQGLQVTVLGGDVHVATLAEIRSRLPAHRGDGQVPPRIFQITSSGVGTPSLSGWKLKLIQLATNGEIELGSPDVVGRLIQINGSRSKVLAQRNFVLLNLEDDQSPGAWDPHGNLRATYFVEQGDDCDALPQVLNGPGE